MGIWKKYDADADGLMLGEDVPMSMNAKNVVESQLWRNVLMIEELIVLLAIALGII